MQNPFKNRILQSFFKGNECACFANKVQLGDSGEGSVPTMEFNLVHIYHHLFTEGVGLRPLMDYYFLFKTISPQDKAITSINTDLGLKSFTGALMWVLGEVFGMELEKMLWQPCEKDGKFLLDEILIAGNFGKYDTRLSRENVCKWDSSWRVNSRNLRLRRFNKSDWFWGPLWRIYHFGWRKINVYN